MLPLLGAAASGPGLGIVFTAACVAAALSAALASTAKGLWWVVPCTPTSLFAVAFVWVTLEGLGGAKTSAAAATDIFKGVAGAFPGVAAGTVAALAVAGTRAARAAADTRRKRA